MFSINDEEILIPQDRLQLAPKQDYTLVQRNYCPYRLQQHKSLLKVEKKQDIQRKKILT